MTQPRRSYSAREVEAVGRAFSSSIRASIPASSRRQAAIDRYVRGDIEVEELEEQLDRIARGD